MALAQLLVDARRRQNPSFVSTIVEVIIDYGYAFLTYGKVTERNRVKSSPTSFLAEVSLIILIGEAYLQPPVIARKFLP